MSLPLATLAIVGGLGLLVIAAEEFVEGAEAVALRLGWSVTVIGAVVVGFGTSLPELVTSALAAWRGQPDLAIGNAAGSNVANLLLILGAAALVAPLRGTGPGPRRDGVIAGVGGLLLLAVSADGWVGTVEALLLVVALVAAVSWQIASARSEPTATEAPLPVPQRFVALRVAGGLIGVLVGAQLLVAGATDLAEAVGVPPIVIGSVLVAVGTSLPELATAIASARKGQVELLLGNLLGSNAFNALMVVGASGIVASAQQDRLAVGAPAIAVVAAAATVTLVAGLVLGQRPRVSRLTGAALVVLHIASIPALLAMS